MGSTRAALRDGIHAAPRAISKRAGNTTPQVQGSCHGPMRDFESKELM